MAKESSKNPLEVLASAPRVPLRTPRKNWRSGSTARSPRTPHKYEEERNHITKQLLPLAQPRPVGAVARVHVVARLRDRLFIKPVRLV